MLPEPDSRAEGGATTRLREAKQAMRGRVLAARQAMPPSEREGASRAIVERVAALASFASARKLLLTLPFRDEWNVRPLAERVLAAGKTLVLPRVDRDARMLVLHAVADLDADVVAGPFGIREPCHDAPTLAPSSIDWVLVPGVAFDVAGRRLGYGGGFYDRLLPLVAPDVPRIAGAFEIQVVDEVPAGPFDQRIDRILTERRTIDIERAPADR